VTPLRASTASAYATADPSGEASSFELVDLFSGFCELVKTSPTLDGSVPLRAARACSPLLDGNRYGLKIRLAEPLELGRSLGGIRVRTRRQIELERALAGGVPRAAAEGLLAPAGSWARRLEKRFAWSERAGSRRVQLFTGLLVRPRPGTWLCLSDAGNRRNLLFEVDERFVRDDGEFAPIVLTLKIARSAKLPLRLAGEIATLGALEANTRIDLASLEARPELGQTHLSFYDEGYFSSKKRGPTRKYRSLIESSTAREAGAAGACLVEAGPSALSVERATQLITARGWETAPESGPERLVFRAPVSMVARFDGHELWMEPDARELADYARAVDRRWRRLFPAELAAHQGGMLYFAKYATPHQRGEPYFFVKPAALVITPPGTSALIQGVHGDGYDVLRGVVATDVFHALPAVLRLDRPGQLVSIPRGAPLARVSVIRREVAELTPRRLPWEIAAR
jgi:hypothetical protein